MKLHDAIRWLHLCAGLAAAVFLLLLGVSGALLVYEEPLNRLLNRSTSYVEARGQPLPLNTVKERLEQRYPGYRVLAFGLPQEPDFAGFAALGSPAQRRGMGVSYNPYTAEVLGTDAQTNRWMSVVHQFHMRLLLGDTGARINGVASLFLVLLALTGLVLWWPRKLFTLTSGASGRRMVFDLHNVTGIYASVFLLIFAVTGAAIAWERQASDWANKITGTAAPPPIPKMRAPAPGAAMLDPERALAIALAAAPGARVTSVQFPGNLQNPIRVNMKYPEDHTPAGRTVLYMNPASGEIIWLQNARTMPLGSKIMRLWNRQVHTGDLFGWPTRLLACLFSLALPVLVITGPTIWWNRIRKKETA
jgi:uncharacterized iron-regulated membrane protein